MNEHSDFFYQHMHGDKETFHLAFRRMKKRYAMPGTPSELVKGTLMQHDFDGGVIFQHRNLTKWCPWGNNRRQVGFRLEATCLRHLRRLDEFPAWREYLARHPAPIVEIVEGTLGEPSLPGKKARPRLVLRSPVNAYTGYGLHTCAIAHDLTARGIDVVLRPTAIQEKFAPVPAEIREMIAMEDGHAQWELLLHPPNVAPRPDRKTVFFTM